jgi:hypothetical protein
MLGGMFRNGRKVAILVGIAIEDQAKMDMVFAPKRLGINLSWRFLFRIPVHP